VHEIPTHAGIPGKDKVPGLLLDPDPVYPGLSSDDRQRKEAYEKWVLSALPESEWKRIREAVQRGYLTGNEKFVSEVAEKLGIRLEMKKPGRPKKS